MPFCSKSLFSLFLSLILVFLTMTPLKAVTDPNVTEPTLTRLAGQDRYSTASTIAQQGWQHSNYAILAYGENFPDALSAAPLAKKYDAPILLTMTNSLPDATKKALVSLQVKEVLIIGGTGVISAVVDSELHDLQISTRRIAGKDRYETAIKIAENLPPPSTVFVAIGEDYADALSVSPIAATKQSPVILVPKDHLPESVKKYISTYTIDKTYVIGDSDIINDTISKQFPNAERISGTDRYARNIAINQKFESAFQLNSSCLATGESFADALTGSAYAAKENAPILLISKEPEFLTKRYYQSRQATAPKTYVFGGTAVISDTVAHTLAFLPPKVKPSLANPAEINLGQVLTSTVDSRSFTAIVTVHEVQRGSEAWSTVVGASKWNDIPYPGNSYFVAKFTISLINIDEGKALPIEQSDFRLVSSRGRVYDTPDLESWPTPHFKKQLHKGESTTGYVIFQGKAADPKPVICYRTDWDGSGGLWFKTYQGPADEPRPSPVFENTSSTHLASSFAHPADLNTTQTIIVKDNHTALLKVTEILRGSDAWVEIFKLDRYNDLPDPGFEYLLVNVQFDLLDIREGTKLRLDRSDFKLTSEDNKEYVNFYFDLYNLKLDAHLYKGASNTGYLLYQVKRDDLKPVVSYRASGDGSGIWFKAYQ